MKNAITKLLIFVNVLLLTFFTKNFTATKTDSEFVLTIPNRTETKKHKQRMRKPSTKKVTKNVYRTYRDMPYDDLEQAKNKLIEKGQLDTAIKYLEQMIKIDTNIERLASHLIEIGNLLFTLEKFSKAGTIYTEFWLLYPGNDKAEFALYRAIISLFNCTLSIDRDQTKTEETILLAQTFLEQKRFTTYTTDVQNIISLCYKKLAESELYISQYYLKKGNIKAVENRLKTIRTTWLKKLPTIEYQLLRFESDLALKKGNSDIARSIQEEIAQKYPTLTAQLSEKKTDKSMMNRF